MNIENYIDFKKFINNVNKENKLLIHSCCAPCSTHVLKLLSAFFDITIFYTNDNIDTNDEYNLRFHELEKLIKAMELKIKLIKDEYDPNVYRAAIAGYENAPEKSYRCYKCYLMRMRKTAILAKEMGFDFFTTTISISPHKNSKWVNEIGYALEKEIGIKFLYSDFKKEDGYLDSINLSKKYDLYRQDYCGCVISKAHIK